MDRLYCHECEDTYQLRGRVLTPLQCPHCQSEFVEIVNEEDNVLDDDDDDNNPNLTQNFNFTFTNLSIQHGMPTPPFQQRGPPPLPVNPLLQLLTGLLPVGPQNENMIQDNELRSFMAHMLTNVGMLQPGFGNENALDEEGLNRFMADMLNNAEGSGPPPASSESIRSLPMKTLQAKDMDEEGKAECSICMEAVKIGDRVKELPCKHWFHGICVATWLEAHNTCPHCRKGIDDASGTRTPQTPTSPIAAPERYDGSSRHSSISRHRSTSSRPSVSGRSSTGASSTSSRRHSGINRFRSWIDRGRNGQ